MGVKCLAGLNSIHQATPIATPTFFSNRPIIYKARHRQDCGSILDVGLKMYRVYRDIWQPSSRAGHYQAWYAKSKPCIVMLNTASTLAQRQMTLGER